VFEYKVEDVPLKLSRCRVKSHWLTNRTAQRQIKEEGSRRCQKRKSKQLESSKKEREVIGSSRVVEDLISFSPSVPARGRAQTISYSSSIPGNFTQAVAASEYGYGRGYGNNGFGGYNQQSQSFIQQQSFYNNEYPQSDFQLVPTHIKRTNSIGIEINLIIY